MLAFVTRRSQIAKLANRLEVQAKGDAVVWIASPREPLSDTSVISIGIPAGSIWGTPALKVYAR